MEDQKRRMESIESTVKSLQRTTSSSSSESVGEDSILSTPGYKSEKKSFDFPTKTESIKDRQLTHENNALSRTNRDLEDQLIKGTQANRKRRVEGVLTFDILGVFSDILIYLKNTLT